MTVISRIAVVSSALACSAPSPRPAVVHLVEAPHSTEPATTTRRDDEAPRGRSFYDAWDHASDDPDGRDLSNEELYAPLGDGAFVRACGATGAMRVLVRVAVLDGRAAGVTVETSPPSRAIARCVDAALRRMTWATSGKLKGLERSY